MKMCELFNVEMGKETIKEVTLEEAYKIAEDRVATFKPVIWMYKLGDMFAVDFNGQNIGMTLKVFNSYTEAKKYSLSIQNMEKSEFLKLL